MEKLFYLLKKGSLFLCLLFFITGYLLLHRLDNAYFWDDEAEVAIFAKNFLKTGELLAWDGRNLMGYQNATTIDDHLISRQPPLMFWVTALSFYLFGPSTWSGRLPFALMGLVSLFLFYNILKKSFPKTQIPYYGIALMGLSTDFLLLSRQCRYYGLILFFCLWIYLQYIKFLEKKSYEDALLLGISASGLFYSNFLIAASFMISLFLLFLYKHTSFFLKIPTKILLSLVTFLILSLPYALMHHIWIRPDFDAASVNHIPWYGPVIMLHHAFGCINQQHFYILWFTLFLSIIAYYKKDIAWFRAFDFLFLGITNIMMLCLFFSNNIPYSNIWDDLFGSLYIPQRYCLASYPFFWTAWSFLIWQSYLIRPIFSWLFLIIFFAGDLFFVHGSEDRYKIPLLSYLKEIHQPFPTAVEKVKEAIFERFGNRQDLTILALPHYESLPLIFYTGDQYLLSGQLRDSKRNEQIIRSLNANYLMYDNFYPDVIVSYGHKEHDIFGASFEEVLFDKQQLHRENNRWVQYHYPLVKVIDIFFYNGSRGDDIYFHTFGTITSFDKDKDAVYLYERQEIISWNCTDFCVSGISLYNKILK